MAYTRDYKWIIDRIKESGIQNYAIYGDAGKKNLISENKTGELTPEQCAEAVNSILCNLSGLVYLELSTVSRGARGRGEDLKVPNQFIQIQLGDGAGAQNVAGIGSFGGLGGFNEFKALVEKNAEDRIGALERELRHKMEVDTLKREIADLKNGSIGEQLLKQVAPKLIDRFLPSPTQPAHPVINGHGDVAEAEEVTEEDQARIERAFGEWLTLDADAITMLEKIVELAKTNPTKYNMAKSLI